MMRVLVVFGLDRGHNAADTRRAYELLAGVGFSRVQGGSLLPKNTVIGTWFKEDDTTQHICNSLAGLLLNGGLKVSHILAAEFTSCVWYGPDLDQR
jgi:hypothetical protein